MKDGDDGAIKKVVAERASSKFDVQREAERYASKQVVGNQGGGGWRDQTPYHQTTTLYKKR